MNTNAYAQIWAELLENTQERHKGNNIYETDAKNYSKWYAM